MKLFTLENAFLRITLSDVGASWLSCIVKMPNEEREVLVTTSAKIGKNRPLSLGQPSGVTLTALPMRNIA